MDPELLPPPPPYTPQDPLVAPSQELLGSVDGPLIHIDSVDTALSTHVNSTSGVPQELSFENTGDPRLGDNQYFRERAPTRPPPETVISYRMVIQLNDNPEHLAYPEPAEKFRARGLTKQDWLTFSNYLFPARGTQPKQVDFSRDEKSSLRTSSKPTSASLVLKDDKPDEEKQYIRRTEIHTVVQEWNTGFFLPRGLLIIAITQPYAFRKSEVNSLSVSGETALSRAVPESRIQLVQTLLLKGADPNLKPTGNIPVLYTAIEKRNLPMTQLLLRHGATSDPKTLHLAASIANDTRPLTLLLTHGTNPDISSWDSFPALYNAVTRSDLPTARLLLAYGAKPEAAPIGSTPPLYQAIKRKDMPMVELLLAYGADPNLKPWAGQPMLHLATQQGDLEVMRLLLAKGAKVNAEQVMVGTALGLAVQGGDAAVVEILLAAGADTNLKPWGGQSPLYCAAAKGDVAVVKMLLEKGAKVDDAPAGLLTPLYMAVGKGDLEMAKTLIKGGADVNANSPLSVAVSNTNMPMVELLLESGADVNRKPWGGMNNLVSASSRGDTRLMKLLLEKGAAVDESPSGYPSALFAAVHRGDLEAAKVLLDYGADMKKKKAGYDALSWAQAQGKEAVLNLFAQYQTKE